MILPIYAITSDDEAGGGFGELEGGEVPDFGDGAGGFGEGETPDFGGEVPEFDGEVPDFGDLGAAPAS